MSVTNRSLERRTLKQYLSRYYHARQKIILLRERLQTLPNGSAPEIITRIQNQQTEMEHYVLEVMDLIDYLPASSMERIILELRHIDCLPWREIHRTVHLTASPCFAYYRRGLNALLASPEVRQTLRLP